METKARRELERSAGSPFPETPAEEGSHALTWGGPGKEDQLEGGRQETRGPRLGEAVRADTTHPPSFALPTGLGGPAPWGLPGLPATYCAPNSLLPLSTLCFHPLISPHVPSLVHPDPHRGGLAGGLRPGKGKEDVASRVSLSPRSPSLPPLLSEQHGLGPPGQEARVAGCQAAG